MKYKNVYFIVGLIGLSACNSGTAPEIEELRRLCALDAGQKIYETVQADGYFDATEDGKFVVSKLLEGPYMAAPTRGIYRYIEFCKSNNSDSYDVGLILKAGCWRVEKVLRRNNQCDAQADQLIKKAKISPYVEFVENQCISVNKINKPESRYRFEYESTISSYNEYSKFYRSVNKVVDVNANHVIASTVGYSLSYEKNSVTRYSCGSPKITGKDHIGKEAPDHVIIQAIKPINN